MTAPARLDADRSAQPLTQIKAVVDHEALSKNQCLLFDHQITRYVVNPTAPVYDPVKDAFVAGFWAGTEAGPTMSVDEAWTEYAASRLERIADDQDELDEPIPYALTDVYIDEWLATNRAG